MLSTMESLKDPVSILKYHSVQTGSQKIPNATKYPGNKQAFFTNANIFLYKLFPASITVPQSEEKKKNFLDL